MINLVIEKYRKRNLIIKYCLFSLILFLFILLYFFSNTIKQDKFVVVSSENNQIQREDNLDINKLRYYSSLNKNDYFEIKADKILQKDKTEYQLYDITANLKFKQNISFKAKDGILNVINKLLKLESIVQFSLNDKYQIVIKSADLDLEANILSSCEKIQIYSDEYDLTANGFKLVQNKAILYFTGPVNFKIKQII